MTRLDSRRSLDEVGAAVSPPRTIRVLLADDQELVRDGFRMILNHEDDIEVVAEASDGRQAVDQAKRLLPHVVLMDVRMDVMDGLEATRRIMQSGVETRVLILTTFDVDEYVYEALRAGASGFLLKDVSAAQLVDGVRVIAGGEALLAPSVTRRLLERFTPELPSADRKLAAAIESLSPRELEVLRLLASGFSNAELAAHFFVSEATVKTHLTHVFRKLQVRDRVQAVIAAYDIGLVRPAVHADRS
jgi:DNA-binding NarL/FixJ family response regulator